MYQSLSGLVVSSLSETPEQTRPDPKPLDPEVDAPRGGKVCRHATPPVMVAPADDPAGMKPDRKRRGPFGHPGGPRRAIDSDGPPLDLPRESRDDRAHVAQQRAQRRYR